MDDTIYRYLYWLAEVLSSGQAIRFYVLLTALIILGPSVLIAFQIKKELEGIADDIFVVTSRGRPPRNPKSVDVAIKNLQRIRKTIWQHYFWRLITLAICAFIIPTAMLYLGATFYEWFIPNQKPLLISDTRAIIDAPTINQVWTFSLNQLNHGALNDYPEVFGREFGNVTNNPENTIFSAAVVIYRFIVGTFGLVIPLFLANITIIAIRMPSARKLIENKA